MKKHFYIFKYDKNKKLNLIIKIYINLNKITALDKFDNMEEK